MARSIRNTLVSSCSVSRPVCKPRSAIRSDSLLKRFWPMSTNVDRKIASSDTTIARSPYGNGSKGRTPTRPVFKRIQTQNHTTCKYKKTIRPEKVVMEPAIRSCKPCAVGLSFRMELDNLANVPRSMTLDSAGLSSLWAVCRFLVQQTHFQHVPNARQHLDQLKWFADEIFRAGLQRGADDPVQR